MNRLIERGLLYARTVRWLRVSQALWFVYRRLRPAINPAPVAVERARKDIATTGFARSPQPATPEFRFLNVASPAEPAHVDWHPAGRSRLWRYNLHYFDYLHWDAIPADWKPAYIDSWIKANPVGTDDGWEPYTVSLRIVNWIKFFAAQAEVPERWQESLINQSNWLTHNLELHILANHFFKNIKALIFAGVWFDGPAGRRFLDTGLGYLRPELAEQILTDGGHFERSPMYHCIVLEDCLDMLNLAERRRELVDADCRAQLKAATHRALHFLDEILGADGHLPMFNDSAPGIAAEPAELFAYGVRLCGYEKLPEARQVRRIAAANSGYFGYHYQQDSMLIDCGQIGPDYQPGHAHCDTLSFELCMDGERIVVDPGVHGYDDDDTRNYLRGTAAHNTVSLDGAEQSEIWGTFRVARRARPIRPHISIPDDGYMIFTGGHDGFRRLPQHAIHRRTIEIGLAGRWTVLDEVSGLGAGTVRSYLHFAPAVSVVEVSVSLWTLVLRGREIATITLDDGCTGVVATSYVATGFGARADAPVLVMERQGPLPLVLGYRIERIAA